MAVKPISPYGMDETRNLLLKDSLTFKVGDLVFASGSGASTYLTVMSNATTGTAGSYYIYGIVTGFRDKLGNIYPSTGQDPTNTPNQVTTGATNVSTVKLQAVVLPIKESEEYEVDLDDTAGTTSYSDQPLVWFNFADCRTLDESTAIAANDGSSPLQFFSLGTIKDPSTSTVTKVRGKFAKANMIGLGEAV